jgi:hypothetical protein
MDLFSKKFTKNIIVLDTVNFKCLTNIETGAFFSVSFNQSFTFRDKDNNFWTTVTKEYRVNREVFFPHEGMIITFEDNTTHTFTTEEEITKLVFAYFKKFIVPPPIITNEKWSLMFYEGIQYTTHYKTFKPIPHDAIDVVYSYN